MKQKNCSSACPRSNTQKLSPACPRPCPSCNIDLYGWLLWQLGLKRCPGQKRCSGWQKRAGCGKHCD